MAGTDGYEADQPYVLIQWNRRREVTFRVCCPMPNGHESKGVSMPEDRRGEYERHCHDQMLRYPGSRYWIEDCGEGMRYSLIHSSLSAGEKP